MSYQRLSVSAKRTLDIERMRERACECPACNASVMPDQLAEHMSMRCNGERPEPPPSARWMRRAEALNYVVAPTLDAWVARGVVRGRSDGNGERYCARDISIATAWARRLGCLCPGA
jgi:hypothetical protein